MRILLAGATGFIGSELIKQLLNDNHQLHILSRSKKPDSASVSYFIWDPSENTIDLSCLKEVDAVINLAGANVGGKRWTKAYKKEISDSRILSTRSLLESIDKAGSNVKVFINTSATGIYGNNGGDKLVSETAAIGNDFLSDVVRKWEQELFNSKLEGSRKVALRLGVVFSEKGGALPMLASPVKYGFGAPLATGKQYLSWVDLQDVVKAFSFALKNEELKGVYNIVAPDPVTNKVLTQKIAKILKRPLWLPNIPAFALKLLLGEFAESIIGGSKVSSQKFTDAGFTFKYPTLESSLKQNIKT